VTNTAFAALADTVYAEREVTNWITSISKQVESWLNRDLKINDYTEYFDTKYNKVRYWIKNAPIITLTSVYEDSSGEWSGSESEIDSDDVYVGADNRSIVVGYPLSHLTPKGLRVIYNGGLAYHGTQSRFAIVSAATFTAGKYVLGLSSGALGIVRGTPTTASADVENLFGIFEAAETLTEYTDEAHTSATAVTAVISSITRQSLAEAYPDIVNACEMEVRFRFKHKGDFEITGSSRDATNIRRDASEIGQPFTTEVMRLLAPYKNRVPE